jgi:hypothetical protein
MFTLIKREIEDSMIFYISAVVIVALEVVILLTYSLLFHKIHQPEGLYILGYLLMVIGLIPVCALGTGQMYYDRTKKISTFLSTLAVTRRKIFTAKVLAGLVGVLFFFLPIAIASKIIVSHLAVPIPAVAEIFNEIGMTILLTHLAVYSIGLQIGAGNARFIHLAALITASAIIPLVMIKGFQAQATLILTLFIITSLTRSWQKFSKASF